METTQITCDHCKADLSTTGNCADYRLLLTNQSIPLRGSVATAMMVSPIIEQDKHFCGLGCLKRWINEQPL